MDIGEEESNLKGHDDEKYHDLKVGEGNDNNAYFDDRVAPLTREGHARQTVKARKRKVSFPNDEDLVSESVEPVDPWANVSNASSSDVVKAYMTACARFRVKPIDKLIKQLKEHDVFQSRINILNLKGVKLDVKSCEALEEIFKRVQVHTLDIENTNLEDEGAIALIEMIEFYQSAIHIHIGYNPRIKTRGWQMFSQMVRKAPFIEFIDMRHCCFNDPCIALMARSLKLNSTLRVLHLEGDNLSGKLLIILCTGLKLNNNLGELFLGDNFLVPSDASILSAMLKSNSTLQLLDVRNNMLQDQGLMHLCDGLHQQTVCGIKTLVLWNNQITRIGMVPLANLMAVNTNIQTLNIGHNRLGNDGIRNLQIGLLKNKSILRLGLLNTKITAEGAVALAEYIADTRSLLRLDLRENDLFVGGLMALTLAVKINETVVRIDLDKDLKKEQGMEGTQTSLLVDIYQYLERNKKLGIEREELKRNERELEAQKMAEKKNEVGNSEVDGTTNDRPVRTNDFSSQTLVDQLESAVLENCVRDDSSEEGNSRFTVSKVNDLKHEDSVKYCRNELESVENNLEGKDVVFEEIKDAPEGRQFEVVEKTINHKIEDEITEFIDESPADDNEDISGPEDFEKELDELLANVSGVNIDLTELPSQDADDFWNKDLHGILESSVN